MKRARAARLVLTAIVTLAYVIPAMVMLVGLCVLVGAAIFGWLGWNYPVALAAALLSVGVLAFNVAVLVTDRRRRPPWLGVEQAIQSGLAEFVNHDDFGKLWRIAWPHEQMLVVEVANLTPEPDGSYRHYFLRVPPSVRTAREAVAWTFRFDADSYVVHTAS
jgi:hypothetical protein